MTCDREKLLKELLSLEPGAAELELAGQKCFHYAVKVPAFTLDFVVVARDDALVVLKARDSYDEELATGLAELVAGKPLLSDTVMVHEGFSCPGRSFDRVTIVPPRWAGCFSGQSELLQACSYWAFPSHRCEIQPGFRGEDFSFLIGKGARISVMDWNREPTPQARVQLLTAWPGGMLAKRKKPGIIQWESVIHTVTSMPPGVSVRLLNALDDEARVTALDGAFELDRAGTGNGGERVPDVESLRGVLRSFFLCEQVE